MGSGHETGAAVARLRPVIAPPDGPTPAIAEIAPGIAPQMDAGAMQWPAGDGLALRPRTAPANDRHDPGFPEPGLFERNRLEVDDPELICPELDCLRGRLPADVLAAAEERAQKIGTGADRVLIAAGAIDEKTYLRALGDVLGIAFEPLDAITRRQCPVNDRRLAELTGKGLLPLLPHKETSVSPDDPVTVVVAPSGFGARHLLRLIARDPLAAENLRLTSTARFNGFVMRCAGSSLADEASNGLHRSRPLMSAAPAARLGHAAMLATVALPSLAAFILAPAASAVILEPLLATVFLAWLGLRLFGALIARPAPTEMPDLNDAALPVYSVIAALYREAASVKGLLAAIERFDYPHEKLDVILAVEADDHDTRAAIEAALSRLAITVVAVPALGPRTKPKALNVALPFARGALTVIYDAEDRPEPDQLRCALKAFRAGGGRLACVQARLCIDNTADSWLSRYFTAEYAGQFDIFLPGLTRLGLPLPLGGSSNHFRTATLRQAGAWDAYNVTEDADLGMRLARLGYRADIITSTTYEEAPARTGAWIRQRTRWFKGWIQTWTVHMREPRRLWRDLGPGGFLAFQLMVGGNVLSALVHPLFLAGLAYSMLRGDGIWHGDTVSVALPGALYGAAALIGYAGSAFLGWLGLLRRGLPGAAWVMVLTPLHWLLLSLAAWRAVFQFTVAPYAWEKTEHGLARTSHRTDRLTRAMLALERDVRDLSDRDALPVINQPPTTAGNRPERRPATSSAA